MNIVKRDLWKNITLSVFALFFLLGITANAHAASWTEKIPFFGDKQRIVLISHAPDTDSWWDTIKNAINVAGDQADVNVEYINPPTGDLDDMARLIRQAADSKPDGMIVTIADFNKLSGAIEYAVSKSIPVITINSGTAEESKKLGALMHIGQPEYDAGLGAGLRVKATTNARRFLCINHVPVQATIDRCKGFSKGLGIELGDQMIDVSNKEDSEIKQQVTEYLRANPNLKVILGIGPTATHPTLDALKELGLEGKITMVSFDFSDKIGQAIKDNVLSFTIDQQPYLQGYMPVIILANLNRYGVLPGNNINSGPGFIHRGNLTLVERYSGEYR